MNKIVITIIVVVVIALGGYFLLRNPGVLVPAPSATGPAPVTEETPSAEQNIVTYTDAGYSPSTLRVKVGATVIFKNNSSQSMWVASAVHPTHEAYPGSDIKFCGKPTLVAIFDACKGNSLGESWDFKFDQQGTWKYHNHLNPGSIGTIAVE